MLTIGIITKNPNLKYLDDLLNSIIQQKDQDTRILISDNDSDISIKKFYPKLLNRSTNIKIIYNDKLNNSIDGNILNIIENCETKYLWLFSDNDTLTKDSIKDLKNYLIRFKPSLVSVDYHECDENLKPNKNRIRENLVTSICYDHDSYIRSSKMLFGLISSVIVNVEDARKINLSKYYFYHSIHIPIVFILATKGTSVIIGKKLVKLRGQDSSKTWGEGGRTILFILKIVYMLKDLEKYGYSKKSCNYVVNHNFKSNLYLIFKSLLNKPSLYTRLQINSFMKYCYKKKIRYWLIDYPIFNFLPYKLVLIIGKIKNFYNKINL